MIYGTGTGFRLLMQGEMSVLGLHCTSADIGTVINISPPPDVFMESGPPGVSSHGKSIGSTSVLKWSVFIFSYDYNN